MKNSNLRLLAGVSALALGLSANSAFAADAFDRIEEAHNERVPSASFSVFGSHVDVDSNEDNTALNSFTSIGGDGKLDIPLGSDWSLQFDAQGEVNLDSGSTSEDYHRGFLGGVHLNYRDPGSHLLGVFGAAGTINHADEDSGQARFHLFGVEGQYHYDTWTFYGQAGVGDLKDDSSETDWMVDNWFARGVVRHYFNDGQGKLQGDVIWMEGEADNDVETWGWGIEAEHHIAEHNDGFVSAFIRYEQYQSDEQNDGTNGSAQVIKGGIRISLGYSNPVMRDRYGTGVDFGDIPRMQSVVRSAE